MKQLVKPNIQRNLFIKSRTHQRLGLLSAAIIIALILCADYAYSKLTPQGTVTIEMLPNE